MILAWLAAVALSKPRPPRPTPAAPVPVAPMPVAPAPTPAPSPVEPTSAALDLAPSVSPTYDEAVRCEEDGDLDQAAFLYRLAAIEQPNITKSTVGLGRVLEKLGKPDQAVRVYQRLPYDPDAVEALGRLFLATGNAEDAAELFGRLRELRPEWPGTRVLEADARSGFDHDGAAGLLTDYLEMDAIDAEGDGLEVAAEHVATALAQADQHGTALGLLQEVLARFPELRTLEPLLAEIAVDEAARRLARANNVPLDPGQADRLREARVAYADGRVGDAWELLEALAAEQPSSAVTWATLADVRQARGDLAGAEQAIAAAERLDPLTAAYPAKLGEILASAFGGRYDDEAADAYARAVLRQADDPELWWSKAVVERRAGRKARANDSFERVLALDPDGPHAAEALREVEGYRRARFAPIVLSSGEPRPDSVPQAAWDAYHRARAWTERPEPDASDRAFAELRIARDQAPRFVPAIDLLAALEAERGDLAGAVELYEESLRIEPDRGRVYGRLAALYERSGRPAMAVAARTKAADLGDPDALWHRAREEAAGWHWLRARATLDDFFVHTTGGPAYESALELDADLAARIDAARIAVGVVGAGVVLAPLAWFARGRTGVGLDALVAREPSTWRDVGRVCGAIRHEVLKHHVSVLPSAIAALDDGDREPVRWLLERMLGAEGPVDRLWAYVAELEGIGRAHGIRLNLRHRDAVFAPMLAAFRRLERIGTATLASRDSNPRLAGELRAVSAALNDTAYRGLGQLLGRMALLKVDGVLVREVYDAVRDEPEFRGEAFPELRLALPDEDLQVRMSRPDLADVLGNLIRNAAQASRGSGADEIGIAVEPEEDAVTALQSVCIRVRDHAAGALTTAALRTRESGRGLGLAMDLTSRAGGSLRVEADPGWAERPW